MKKVVLAFGLAFSFMVFADNKPALNLAPQKNSPKDSVTISSGYFEKQYTNDQLAVFGLEVLRGMSRLKDYVENPYAKMFVRLFGYWTGIEFHLAFHEIGHALRGKAFGCDYMMPSNSKENIDNPRPFSRDENFFQFFVKKLVIPHRGDPIVTTSGHLSKSEQFIITAGGLNNNVYFSERISRELHSKGSISDIESFAYLWGKIHPIIYSNTSKRKDKGTLGDPLKIEDYYKEVGISAGKKDIVLAGALSTLLSGTTWSIIKGAYSSLENFSATPLEFRGFRAPDVFSYVTSKGISYKIASGYKMHDNMNLIFGMEHVFHGKSATEFNLGLNKTFGPNLKNISCEIVATLGKGFDVEASCSIPVFEKLSFNFGGGSYACKSLLGERHARNMKEGKNRSNNLFVSMSYKY